MKDIGRYILYSENLKKYYVGACQENLEERILKHNTSFYGKKCFTSTTYDWALKLFMISKKFDDIKSVCYKLKLKQ